MIVLKNTATGDNLAAKQDAGTDVNCHVSGAIVSTTTGLIVGSLNKAAALSTTATSITGTPAANNMFVIGSIKITNTGASSRIVTLYLTDNSVTYAAGNQWGATIVLAANESAEWDGQWIGYNSTGDVVVTQDYSIYAAKGTILAASAAGIPAAVAVGTNGLVLAADSSAAAGVKWVKPVLTNFSTANQTGFAADTYLAGSSIAIPAGLVRAGTLYHLIFDMVKTAAGTATPILIVRFGTAGTTADTARLTFTFAAGTAAIDTGVVQIWAHFRNVGASAVLVGIATIEHHLAATGLTSTGASGQGILPVTSGAFDSTVANSIIGVSFNGGTSFSGTNTLVQAEARELNI